MTRSTARMRNLADFATAMSRLEDWLREHAGALKAPEDACSWAAKHLVEHGNVLDDPSRALYACAQCGTTFTVPAGQPAAACPRCGHHAAALPHGGEPPAGRICGCVRAWGRCGYRSDCKVCGASAVLFDLELALADRSSRSHTLDLVHHVTKASEAHEHAVSDYERARVGPQFSAELANGRGCVPARAGASPGGVHPARSFAGRSHSASWTSRRGAAAGPIAGRSRIAISRDLTR